MTVPPVAVDGLTTDVTAALNAAADVVLDVDPPPHAASTMAAVAPNAARPIVLRLLMRCSASCRVSS
jgi:hypothetical protein